MENKHDIEEDVQCTSCHGTGLYKGFCEKDQAAVICTMCHGTGCMHVSFTRFHGRVQRSDVARVYQISDDRVLSALKRPTEGVSYDEWITGAQPVPLSNHCPIQHYYNTEKLEHIKNKLCTKHRIELTIVECSEKNRMQCWKDL